MFTDNWEISETTLSPNFPQSNGLEERTVQTAEDMLIKIDITGHDFNLALLKHRNTLVDDLASSSQLLMSRNLRSAIPCIKLLLTPKTICHKQFQQNWIKQQSRQSKYHDRQSKEQKPLQIGQPVQAQICGKFWQARIIKSRCKPKIVHDWNNRGRNLLTQQATHKNAKQAPSITKPHWPWGRKPQRRNFTSPYKSIINNPLPTCNDDSEILSVAQYSAHSFQHQAPFAQPKKNPKTPHA